MLLGGHELASSKGKFSLASASFAWFKIPNNKQCRCNDLVSRKQMLSVFYFCLPIFAFVSGFKSGFMDISLLSHKSQIIGIAKKLKVLKTRLNWHLVHFTAFRGIKAPCGVAAVEQPSSLQPSACPSTKLSLHF